MGTTTSVAAKSVHLRDGLVKGGRLRTWLVRGLLVASVCWLFAACVPRDGHVRSYVGITIPTESISDHVAGRMDELGIPGLSLAIVNDGEVRYAETFGYADVAAGEPVTDETIFEGASLSKPVFAMFVMTFVEDGSLDLDRPLHRYLPHPDVNGDPRAERITARMVLSHQAGFPNWREDRIGGALPINFEPGTNYEYSGEGYQYLAMVLREITATDWSGLDALFQERIAEPLGMKRTVFIQNDMTRRHKAVPYDADGVPVDWRADPVVSANESVFVAAASIHTDASDFAAWMIGVMARSVLGDGAYRELFTPHATPPPDGLDVSYTLGFYRPEIPLTNLYGHGGNNDGFTSFFLLDADDGWGYVLFTNSEYGQEFGEELLLHLFAGPSRTTIALTALSVFYLVSSSVVLVLRTVRRLLSAAYRPLRELRSAGPAGDLIHEPITG